MDENQRFNEHFFFLHRLVAGYESSRYVVSFARLKVTRYRISQVFALFASRRFSVPITKPIVLVDSPLHRLP
jgi:hypothetical protein